MARRFASEHLRTLIAQFEKPSRMSSRSASSSSMQRDPTSSCMPLSTNRTVPEPEVALNGLPVGAVGVRSRALVCPRPPPRSRPQSVRKRHRCRNIASRAVPDVRDRVAAEYFLERQTRGRNLGSHGGAARVPTGVLRAFSRSLAPNLPLANSIPVLDRKLTSTAPIVQHQQIGPLDFSNGS